MEKVLLVLCKQYRIREDKIILLGYCIFEN